MGLRLPDRGKAQRSGRLATRWERPLYPLQAARFCTCCRQQGGAHYMRKILAAVFAGAVSSAAALGSPRETELFKVNIVRECVNEATARAGNAANVADVILQVCTCSADFLARVATQDEIFAAANGRPPPSLAAKMGQAFKDCRPANRPR